MTSQGSGFQQDAARRMLIAVAVWRSSGAGGCDDEILLTSLTRYAFGIVSESWRRLPVKGGRKVWDRLPWELRSQKLCY